MSLWSENFFLKEEIMIIIRFENLLREEERSGLKIVMADKCGEWPWFLRPRISQVSQDNNKKTITKNIRGGELGSCFEECLLASRWLRWRHFEAIRGTPSLKVIWILCPSQGVGHFLLQSLAIHYIQNRIRRPLQNISQPCQTKRKPRMETLLPCGNLTW